MKNKLQKVGLAVTSAAVGLGLKVNQIYAQGAGDASHVGSGTTLGKILKPAEIGGNLSFNELVPQIINLVFIVAAAMTFFYLIFGAISWITSGGDKSKVEAARNKITAAVIGLLILAATWAVFTLIVQIFFGTDINQVELPKFKSATS